MPSVIVEKGIRSNTHYIYGPDSYAYHFVKYMRGGRVSLRCAHYVSKRCKARASCAGDGSSFRKGQLHRHRCLKSPHYVAARRFRRAVLNECRRTENATKSLMSIYHSVRRRLRVPAVAASHWNLQKLRPSMQRARASVLPPIPHTLSELATTLEDPQYAFFSKTLDRTDDIFMGKFGQTAKETRVLIFMSKRLIPFMCRVRAVMSDATFSSVPASLGCAQVWTILALRRHHIIPLARILMQSKLQDCYIEALTALKELVPNFNPRKVTCDFETAQSNAWEMVFPDIEIIGCLFHSSKAIAGHAKEIGLAIIIRDNEVVDSIIRSMCALALLPKNKLEKGLITLVNRTLAEGYWQLLEPMFKYIRDTWYAPSKKRMFSVYKSPDRTSNACESCNASLRSAVAKPHPNVWSFMFALLDLEDVSFFDLCTLDAGLNPSRKRKESALLNDAVIAGLTEDLDGGFINVDTFLRRASRRIQNVYDQILNNL